jgi:PAS domain-containing protein
MSAAVHSSISCDPGEGSAEPPDILMSENIDKLREISGHLLDPDFAVRLFEDGYPDAIVVVDALGVIKLVNKHMELLFGYHRSELYDQPIEMLVPEASRPN